MSSLDILQDFSVPVDLCTGLPTRLLISMDASLEPSHSPIEKETEKKEVGERKSRLDANRTFLLYLHRSRVFYCAGKQIVLREIISFSPVPGGASRIPWNGSGTCTRRPLSHFIASISWRDSFQRIPRLLPFEFSPPAEPLLPPDSVPPCHDQLELCLLAFDRVLIFLWG